MILDLSIRIETEIIHTLHMDVNFVILLTPQLQEYFRVGLSLSHPFRSKVYYAKVLLLLQSSMAQTMIFTVV